MNGDETSCAKLVKVRQDNVLIGFLRRKNSRKEELIFCYEEMLIVIYFSRQKKINKFRF